MKFTQPDPRFDVSAGISDVGRKTYIFASTNNSKPPHLAEWKAVEGAQVYLVGDVEEELKGLILEHGNKGLHDLIGISGTTLRAVRAHLGIAVGDGSHGGRRHGSGQKVE